MDVIGSRPTRIKPEKRSRGREPIESLTTELIASVKRSALRRWSQALPEWASTTVLKKELPSIEQIFTLDPHQKIKGDLTGKDKVTLEIILHVGEIEGEITLLDQFGAFLEARGIDPDFGRRFYAQGLCFLEMEALANTASEIATFSTVRALRMMPELRLLRPTIKSAGIPSPMPDLPEEAPVSLETRVAIFDGGILVDHPITQDNDGEAD